MEQLGGKHVFGAEIVCKEVAEVTDRRAWDEREKIALEEGSNDGVDGEGVGGGAKGYKKMKCRLCDRRMKNPIEKDALEALATLGEEGRVVQMVRSPLFSSTLSTPKAFTNSIYTQIPARTRIHTIH